MWSRLFKTGGADVLRDPLLQEDSMLLMMESSCGTLFFVDVVTLVDSTSKDNVGSSSDRDKLRTGPPPGFTTFSSLAMAHSKFLEFTHTTYVCPLWTIDNDFSSTDFVQLLLLQTASLGFRNSWLRRRRIGGGGLALSDRMYSISRPTTSSMS